jgi:AraC-like DNA-binding protein
MEYIKQDLKTIFNVKQIVTVHYFELTKSTNYPVDIHDFWEIHYVDKGTAISQEGEDQYVLGQGDVLFHKPNAYHRLKANGQIAPNVCVISFVCNSKEMRFFEDKKFHLSAELSTLLRSFFDEAHATFEISHTTPELKKLARRQDGPVGGLQMLKLYLEAFLLLLFRETKAQNSKIRAVLSAQEYPDSVVNEIIGYMRENVTQKLSLTDICMRFRYGKTYLCSRFRAVTGKTILHFFTEMKIAAAKQMIRDARDGAGRFSQISDTLNFSTPAYFYTTFKKVTGMTPSEYAASIRHYNTTQE